MKHLDELIDLAIREDLGDGDHTSLACISEGALGSAQLVVKEEGIIAGVSITKKVFHTIDPSLSLKVEIEDGTHVHPKDVVFIVTGNTKSILKSERLVLNFMQRMSGIATKTNYYSELIKDLKAKVIDTRKTAPGLREVEKMAVTIGGGVNHRMGLFDMVMIKDNHIDYCGGIKESISRVAKYLDQYKKSLKIIIEVRNLNELEEVLQSGGVHRILLDNFSIEQTKDAVAMVNGKFETESSGGINEKTIRGYAECGVDYISVGALTHQINGIDLSLKAI